MGRIIGLAIVALLSAMMIGGVLPAGPMNAIGESPRSDGVILVHNVYDLQNMSLDLNSSYALANDIDASGYRNWSGGNGFEPVGNDTGTYYDEGNDTWVHLTTFNGIFDGRNHSISALFIKQYSTEEDFRGVGQTGVGLFGQISSTARVSNVRLINVNISGEARVGGVVGNCMSGTISACACNGTVFGKMDCGGIVGFLDQGSVQDCVFNGIIEGPASRIGGIVGNNAGGIIANCSATGSSKSNVCGGGLVGFNNGDLINCWSNWSLDAHHESGGLVGENYDFISNCRSSGEVFGGSYCVGGLVGVNRGLIANCTSDATVSGTYCTGGLAGQNAGMITNSSSTGLVSSSGNYTGGLVGANSWFNFRETPTDHGTIEDCYSTSPVAGDYYVGGLVSFNVDSARTARCYSTGTVSGSSNLGGLIGFNNGTVVDSFWDRQSASIVSSAGGLGLDTVDMMQSANYPGWDFRSTWVIDEGASYPELRMFEGSRPSIYQYPIISHQDYLTLEAYTSNSVHYQFKAYHTPADNDLVWSVQSKFSWLSIDSITGVLYGIPSYQDIATSEYATVTVTDAMGRSNSTRMVISVFQGPPAWVTVPGNTEIRPGDDFDFNVSARCSEPNHTIAYGITSVPVIGITVDFASGRILWRNAQAGNYTITVTASSSGHTASHTFRLKVRDTITVPENLSPVWLSVPSDRELTEGDEYRFQLRASDADINDSIAYGLGSSAPAGLIVSSTTGELLWLNVPAGNHTINLTASDGRVVIRHQFVLHVIQSIPVNGHPTIPSDLVPGSATSVVVASSVIAVVLGLAVASLTEVGKYGLLGFLMPLYTRLRREEVLDNETRGMIRGFIMADPGIHYNEIQRRFKLGNGNLTHHLVTLEREGFIKSLSDGYLRRFYPSDMRIADQPPRLPKIQRIILETVQESEGLSQRDIARVLDMSYSTASRHVNKLAELGLLRLEKNGMAVKCYLSGPGAGGETQKG